MADPVVTPEKEQLSKAEAAKNVVNMLNTVAARVADEDDHDALVSILRALQTKPGVQTTEFWLAMLLNTVGSVLCFVPGREIQGGIMLSVGTIAYTLSRIVVKAAEAKAGTSTTTEVVTASTSSTSQAPPAPVVRVG